MEKAHASPATVDLVVDNTKELRCCDRNVFVEASPQGVLLPALHRVSLQDVFSVKVEGRNGALLGDDFLGSREHGKALLGIRLMIRLEEQRIVFVIRPL